MERDPKNCIFLKNKYLLFARYTSYQKQFGPKSVDSGLGGKGRYCGCVILANLGLERRGFSRFELFRDKGWTSSKNLLY